MRYLSSLIIAISLFISSTAWCVDFNNDGYEDLVVSMYEHSGAHSYISYGSASGYTEANRFYLEADCSRCNSIADLNSDGYYDIVFSVEYEGPAGGPVNIYVDSLVYWGTESGYSESNKTLLPTIQCQQHELGDLNKDGYLDIVFCTGTTGNSIIYWGSDSGYDAQSKTELYTRDANGVTIDDIDGDSWLDIVFGCITTSYIYWGSDTGFSANNRTDIPSRQVTGNDVADLNSDGYNDIVLSDYYNGVSVIWGSASGIDLNNKITFSVSAAQDVTAKDINGDSHIDIILSSSSSGPRIYWNSSTGLNAQNYTQLSGYGHHWHEIADINADEYLDLIVPNIYGNTSYIYPGNESGTFSESTRINITTNRVMCMSVTPYCEVSPVDYLTRTINNSGSITENITIDVAPPSSTLSYAVEEYIPSDIIVSNINENGCWDADNRTIRWGPFHDNNERQLSYNVIGLEGTYSFSGVGSFNGLSAMITGDVEATFETSTTDTDDDGLTDQEEVFVYNTNPNDADSDDDQVSDGDEVLVYNTQPLDNDSDDDELTDYQELFNVADVDALDQLNTTSYNVPRVMHANNGTYYFVVWSKDRDEGSIVKNYGRLLDQNGTPIAPQFELNISANTYVDAIATNGDSFLIVWASGNIMGQIFDSNGNKVGSEFIINTSSSIGSPSIASNGDSFLVAWIGDEKWDLYSFYALKYQLLDNSGNKIGTEQIILNENKRLQLSPSVASNGDNYFVAWIRNYIDVHPFIENCYDVLGHIVDQNGNMSGSIIEVSDIREIASQYDSAVKVEANNMDYCVSWKKLAWYDETSPLYYEINTRLYNNSGTPYGDKSYIIFDDPISPIFDFNMVKNGDEYLIHWNVDDQTSSVVMYPVSENGVIIDNQIVVNSLLPNNYNIPTRSINQNYSFVPFMMYILNDGDIDYRICSAFVDYEPQNNEFKVKFGAISDPNNPDTDGEGLWDGEEVNEYDTNPLNPDSDADGVSDYDEVQQGTDPNVSNLLMFSVHCPVELHIYNSAGEHCGPVGEGEIEFGIPACDYIVTGDSKSCYVPVNDTYTVLIIGLDDGEFDFVMRKLAGDVTQEEKVYLNIPVRQDSAATLDVENIADDVPIQIDSDGDGYYEDTSEPLEQISVSSRGCLSIGGRSGSLLKVNVWKNLSEDVSYGWVIYTARERRHCMTMISRSIEDIKINAIGEVVVSGTCLLNGRRGYNFSLTVKDVSNPSHGRGHCRGRGHSKEQDKDECYLTITGPDDFEYNSGLIEMGCGDLTVR